MYELWKLDLPSSVTRVWYGFDCPYHGKDCCDPEGGVCKRRLDALQMKMQRAFESCRAAFAAMQRSSEWTLITAARPRTTSPLGVFIERRSAVWVEHEQIEQLRAAAPRLRPLRGIRGSVYGLRWVPGVNQIFLSRFLCLCVGCHTSATPCAFPKLCQWRQYSFHLLPARSDIKVLTVKQLKAFLAIHAPHLPQTGRKPALVTRVATLLTWGDGEREACTDSVKLTVAVTKKVLVIEAALKSRREQKEKEALEAARQHNEAQELASKAKDLVETLQGDGLQSILSQLQGIHTTGGSQATPRLDVSQSQQSKLGRSQRSRNQ